LGKGQERVGEFRRSERQIGSRRAASASRVAVGRESAAAATGRKRFPRNGINAEHRERKLSAWRVHRWVTRVRDRVARLPVSYGFRTMSRASAFRKCGWNRRLHDFESVTVSAERAGRYRTHMAFD